MRTWFYNNGRKRDHKDKLTYVRKWNVNQVVGCMKKQQIEDLCRQKTNSEPGSKSYLAGYQKALASVVDNLGEEEVEEYSAMAKVWNNTSPPVDVQRRYVSVYISYRTVSQWVPRMAELHGAQYVKEFSKQMFMQLGMRVLVLSAHHDTTGTLSLAT